MKIIESTTYNPSQNLAFEETLFEKINSDELILFFYINSESVVMGRHQNPWSECPNVIGHPSIPLLRRFSGGGTVFHDLGNLNIALMGKKPCDNQILTDLFCTPLKKYGLDVEYSKTFGDLFIQDAKISGRAHYIKKDKSIHHATLLISSKLNTLKGLLQRPYKPYIETHATSSRIAKNVLNLNDLCSNLTIMNLKQQIINYVYQQHTISEHTYTNSFYSSEIFINAQKKHLDPKWIYGNTPEFLYTFPSNIINDSISLPKVKVKQGYIVDLIETPQGMREKFIGKLFSPQELNHAYYQKQKYNKNFYKLTVNQNGGT